MCVEIVGCPQVAFIISSSLQAVASQAVPQWPRQSSARALQPARPYPLQPARHRTGHMTVESCHGDPNKRTIRIGQNRSEMSSLRNLSKTSDIFVFTCLYMFIHIFYKILQINIASIASIVRQCIQVSITKSFGRHRRHRRTKQNRAE